MQEKQEIKVPVLKVRNKKYHWKTLDGQGMEIL